MQIKMGWCGAVKVDGLQMPCFNASISSSDSILYHDVPVMWDETRVKNVHKNWRWGPRLAQINVAVYFFATESYTALGNAIKEANPIEVEIKFAESIAIKASDAIVTNATFSCSAGGLLECQLSLVCNEVEDSDFSATYDDESALVTWLDFDDFMTDGQSFNLTVQNQTKALYHSKTNVDDKMLPYSINVINQRAFGELFWYGDDELSREYSDEDKTLNLDIVGFTCICKIISGTTSSSMGPVIGSSRFFAILEGLNGG